MRARYAKIGKLRFISAIDLGRIWERSLRHADLPIAYSEGFSPHPKVSFPDALPLGYASTGEYVELTFAAPVAIEPSVRSLNSSFPPGLQVLAAVGVSEGAPRLSKWLAASCWDMDYPGVDAAVLTAAVASVDRADTAPVERERKGKSVQVDLRPAIAHIAVFQPDPTRGPRVRVVLHHVEPPVRPTEVHLALDAHRQPQCPALPEPALVTRIAQGRSGPDGLDEALTGEHVPARPVRADS